MLETKEAKYILTLDDGKMFACYQDFDSAETDAKDLVTTNPKLKCHIYELMTTTRLGEKYIQNTYELKSSYSEATAGTEAQKESTK
jgi:hypothetical protein